MPDAGGMMIGGYHAGRDGAFKVVRIPHGPLMTADGPRGVWRVWEYGVHPDRVVSETAPGVYRCSGHGPGGADCAHIRAVRRRTLG